MTFNMPPISSPPNIKTILRPTPGIYPPCPPDLDKYNILLNSWPNKQTK
jgi:hypothetical protein